MWGPRAQPQRGVRGTNPPLFFFPVSVRPKCISRVKYKIVHTSQTQNRTKNSDNDPGLPSFGYAAPPMRSLFSPNIITTIMHLWLKTNICEVFILYFKLYCFYTHNFFIMKHVEIQKNRHHTTQYDYV